MLRAPFSSEFDPPDEAEGSTDPLGLFPSYERLADRLLPAVTVRMGHPRFVTAIAVGARVCEDWDADAVAADDLTPPWLVWEWFVVEAFVRSEDSSSTMSGVPGIQKVRRALRNRRPVCATAYLKTPSAFGFTGVYRRLARGIGIITDDGTLDDGGYELVSAWAKDQGLDGFLEASGGAGSSYRERLRRAVAQGMEKGHTTTQPRDFWREFARRLDPMTPGSRERSILIERILSRAGNVEMVAHLTDALIKQRGVGGRDQEAPFLRKLSRGAPPELRNLLTAIEAYEAFGRTITDAFDGMRYCASTNGGAPLDAESFAATKTAKSTLELLAPSLARVRSHPTLMEWDRDYKSIAQAIERFEGVRTITDLFEAILHHHEQIQRGKPPQGKRTWFERGTRGRVVLRAGHTVQEPFSGKGGFVHEYRIPTFSGFLNDLGVIR